MRALAQHKNVVVKVSGAISEAAHGVPGNWYGYIYVAISHAKFAMHNLIIGYFLCFSGAWLEMEFFFLAHDFSGLLMKFGRTCLL